MSGEIPNYRLDRVLPTALQDVASFLHSKSSNEESPHTLKVRTTADGIERRLRWLLVENPVAGTHDSVGYCVRDAGGVLRGIDLFFPVPFLYGEKRLLGLCSGTFLVDRAARSLGFYLFKKFLSLPGYAFYFASTCNARSSELWRSIGALPLPRSETEFLVPLRAEAVMAAYVGYKTGNHLSARMAGLCGRSMNPILKIFNQRSAKLRVEPCQDWEKLSDLSDRHRSPDHVVMDRSPALLRWRYGPGSPLHPSHVFLFRDGRGNEGWFSLGYLTRGQACQFRACVLLDLVWPRQALPFRDIFRQVLRTVTNADAISFQWQPGVELGGWSPLVIRRRLDAPQAFVRVPKAARQLPLDSVHCDPTDYIAWAF